MAQTIRLTITPDLEKALDILRQSTLGTLNTTELIKMAIGGFAQIKKANVSSVTLKDEATDSLVMNAISSHLFYDWAKEDGTLQVDNIAHPEKLKQFKPK